MLLAHVNISIQGTVITSCVIGYHFDKAAYQASNRAARGLKLWINLLHGVLGGSLLTVQSHMAARMDLPNPLLDHSWLGFLLGSAEGGQETASPFSLCFS